MQVKVTRINIQRTRASWPDTVFMPAYVASRAASDTQKWLVADSAIDPATTIVWANADHDEFIRIPIFQYDIVPQGDLALAFMFKLGLICAGQLNRSIRHLHIVTGDPVELITGDDNTPVAMRGWLGFAVAFEE